MKFIQFVVPAAIFAIASSAMAATPDSDAARKDRMDAAYQSYRAKAADSRFMVGARKAPAKMGSMKAKRSGKAAGGAKVQHAK